jgi:hypothetical protein
VRQVGTSLIEVLERVLDKGIVVDAWVRRSLVGIVIDAQTRVHIAVHPWTHNLLKREAVREAFADGASSVSALRSSDDDDGRGNTGSSGAPALLYVALQPRRRPAPRPRRTHHE